MAVVNRGHEARTLSFEALFLGGDALTGAELSTEDRGAGTRVFRGRILGCMLFDGLPSLLLSSAQGTSGVAARWMRREAKAERLTRLVAGVYVETELWSQLTRRQKHLLRILAVVPRSSRVVLSHESAATVLGVPLLEQPGDVVHVTDPARTGGWRRAGAITHTGSLTEADVIEIDGYLVTSPVRTAVDLALRPGLRAAVSAVDSVLYARLTTKDALLADVDARPSRRGCLLAADAIGFADARAQLPGESLTRVVLRELGAPAPDLQTRFLLPNGQVAFTDFCWRDLGVVLEFDGNIKYSDPAYRGTLTLSEVIVRERKREKLLLRLPDVRDVVRTDWMEVHAVRPLAVALREAGVPVPHG